MTIDNLLPMEARLIGIMFWLHGDIALGVVLFAGGLLLEWAARRSKRPQLPNG